jgi:hypothetical protein
VRSIATRTTWESVPCSAWERRSDATNIGLAVLSAITCDPLGSFFQLLSWCRER